MSGTVTGLVPASAGASPTVPPEPPPRDYSIMCKEHRQQNERQIEDGMTTNVIQTAAGGGEQTGDPRIKERIEACRMGMVRLDALRNKHAKLMEEMRGRLPAIPGCADVQARIKRNAEGLDRFSLQSVQSVDSGLSSISQISQPTSTRCSSPAASHRSSVSSDSLYSSSDLSTVPPTMPYSTFRKISLEKNEIPKVPIVTTSRFTTRRHGMWKKPDRPRSMYDKSSQCFEEDEPKPAVTQTTAVCSPPVQRKHAVASLSSNRTHSTHALFPSSANSTHPAAPAHSHITHSSPLFTRLSPSSTNYTPPIPHRLPLAPVRFVSNSSPQSPQRPLRTAQKPEVVKIACPVKTADVVFHASRIFMDRSPSADRKQRPCSLFDVADEPLYATPARVKDIVASLKQQQQIQKQEQKAVRKNTQQPQQRHSPMIVKKVALTGPGAEFIRNARLRVVDKKQWRESEGL